MTSKEFIKEVADRADVSQKDTRAVIQGMREVLKEKVAEGEDVTCPKFFTMKIKDIAAKPMWNPSLGVWVKYKERKTASLKLAQHIKDAGKISDSFEILGKEKPE